MMDSFLIMDEEGEVSGSEDDDATVYVVVGALGGTLLLAAAGLLAWWRFKAKDESSASSDNDWTQVEMKKKPLSKQGERSEDEAVRSPLTV
mmetsp:Transcript_9588/g.15935  ORF Transcript_9588/g.15935 Transcript_9588/m.15935 type:complete len:91 (+) Transcript_9588:929-1201(+)